MIDRYQYKIDEKGDCWLLMPGSKPLQVGRYSGRSRCWPYAHMFDTRINKMPGGIEDGRIVHTLAEKWMKREAPTETVTVRR